jgi:eukaryotic-like serine/threonine-protein kinase
MSLDPETIPDNTSPAGRRCASTSGASGYELGAVIGRGGMGEVVLARDVEIGRDVALKRMRGTDPLLLQRFLREARIQARLDHPAVAPVYEIGYDDTGHPFFTMKRLAGTTLSTVLASRKETLQRILRAFVDVCLAIEFAHSRGVVHRDLKPSNIMLGDFGEVYVLDWGVARVLINTAVSMADINSIEVVADQETQVGAILGTPGHVAPEQVRGDATLVGPAADVYSLGAILFEILTGDSLHPRGSTPAIASTLAAPTVAPGTRQHGIAPELDTACLAALQNEPHLRPTARRLADMVQHYLDGDRDIATRRALAKEQLATAKRAASEGDRAKAMQCAGVAIGLDREISAEAASLIACMTLEVPATLPPELAERLRITENEVGSREAGRAALSLLAYFLCIPLLLLVDVRQTWLVVTAFVFIATQIAYAAWMWKARRPMLMPALLLNVVLMVLFTRLFGPLLLIPTIVATYSIVWSQQSQLIDRPWHVIAIAVASLLLPILFEGIGLFSRTWSMTDGAITFHPPALGFIGTGAAVFLLVAHIAIIVVTTLFGHTVAAQRRDAQQRLEIHSWYLRQLVPVDMAAPLFVSGPRPSTEPP